MRTTIEINDRLLRDAEKRAVEEGTTLGAIVDRALRDLLGVTAPSYRLSWRPERGRLRPGVKLGGRGALFDLMEGRR